MKVSTLNFSSFSSFLRCFLYLIQANKFTLLRWSNIVSDMFSGMVLRNEHQLGLNNMLPAEAHY